MTSKCSLLLTDKGEIKWCGILVKVGEAIPQNLGHEYQVAPSAVLQASTTTSEWETRF